MLKMNKNIYILFAFIISVIKPQLLLCQWEVQNPLPTESFLLTVEAVTNNLVFAGGLGGTLLKTKNAGKTWDVQKFKDLVNIRGITFKDSLNGWLIDSEHIYYTSDGGENWREIYINADMSKYFLLDILCFNNTIYLFLKPQTAVSEELIKATSLVMKSTNGGKTWVKIDQEIKGKMLCVYFINENYGFLYAEETASMSKGFTSLYKTTDGGKSWIKKITEIPWTTGLYFMNPDVGFIGKYGTSDGGSTWQNMFPNILTEYENVENIFFSDSLHGWAVSWNKILQTDDGGFSWKVLNQFGSHKLTSIDFSMDGTGWIVGWAGNILRKDADNDIWKQMSEGSRNTLNDVFFIDKNTGWCVGVNGCILHTSNGGETWEKQNSPVDSVFFSVKFLNKLDGWIAGHYIVLHTIDGGKNWKVRNDLKKWFVDVDFFDDNNGLLIERFGNVYRTTDGGTNWQIINEQPFQRLTSIAIVNENEAWIGGWQGLVHITDKGTTLHWKDAPVLSLVKDIQFVNNNIGFLSNDRGDFFCTDDGGWIWRDLPREKGLDAMISTFFAQDNYLVWIYLGLASGYLKQITANQTLSVIQEYWIHPINSIFFINADTGWAVGDGGTILKYTEKNTTSSELQSTRIDIFPNPLDASGSFIKFTLHREQNVIIQVFNLLGQKVQTIYNGLLFEGTNIFRWGPNNISSGIFFINVKCLEFNEAKKCVYIHR